MISVCSTGIWGSSLPWTSCGWRQLWFRQWEWVTDQKRALDLLCVEERRARLVDFRDFGRRATYKTVDVMQLELSIRDEDRMS